MCIYFCALRIKKLHCCCTFLHSYPSRTKPDRSWSERAFPAGTFFAHGFEEQLVAIVPAKDVVLIRLGATKEVVLKWEKERFYTEVMNSIPNTSEPAERV